MKRFETLSQLKSNRHLRLYVFVVAFAAIGLYFLAVSRASTPTASFEAETATTSANCVLSDAAASAGKALKFDTTCAGTPAAGYGSVVPDTAYPIPTGAIFMATNGSDGNAGTQQAPVKTLGAAITKVASGGTIVARQGVYRDSNTPIVNGKFLTVSKKFTLQSYPHEQVWFDGTDQVTNWTSDGAGRWYVSWSTPDFCQHYANYPTGGYYTQIWPWQGTPSTGGPCVHADMVLDPASDPDPQMAFLDSTALTQARSLAGVNATSFYNDTANRRIYIGVNPSGRNLEITKRPMALALEGGTGGNIIRGIGFRRYATNQKGEGSYTHGAIMANVPNVTLENTVFTQMGGSGMFFANPTGAIVRSSIFANNSFNGFGGNGHSHIAGRVDGLDIENNVFSGNNVGLFGDGCSKSCTHAGIKLAHMRGFTLKNNLFENQRGSAHGFWCDLDCSEGVMVNNVFRNNGGAGVFYEVSDTGIIASNLIIGNKRYGIKMGAANTKIYNNTLIDNATQLLIFDDRRTLGVEGWDDVGPDTTNVSFANNVMVNTATTGADMVESWRTNATAPNTGPNTFYALYNYNSYFRNGSTVKVSEWRDGTSVTYSGVAALNSAHNVAEPNGQQDVTNGSNPFTNLAGGNYTFRSGVVLPGTALPSDVAAAIGVSSGTTNRGAIRWWPNGN
jgi:hypothetical protein